MRREPEKSEDSSDHSISQTPKERRKGGCVKTSRLLHSLRKESSSKSPAPEEACVFRNRPNVASLTI